MREPPPLNGLNKSLDARSIDSLSKRNLPWATAVAKGARFLCRLENPELLNDQSSVTSIDMLTASGWTRDIRDIEADVFDTLNSFFLQEGISNNPDDFHGVCWEHAQSSKNLKGEDVPVCYAMCLNRNMGYAIMSCVSYSQQGGDSGTFTTRKPASLLLITTSGQPGCSAVAQSRYFLI